MARRAFVMGSNGPKSFGELQYAVRDANQVAKHLKSPRCGFEITKPRRGDDKYDVLRRLENVALACEPDDTFVCYFSGHGELEKGDLYLVWDERQSELLKASINVADVRRYLRDSPARNKLLILDCCRAGAAGEKAGLGDPVQEFIKTKPENYVILMASGRLEKAREFDTLQGSFLATKLCEALGRKFAQADRDHDSRISITDLKFWLEESANQHNRLEKEKVPTPYLFGEQKGDFFITRDNLQWTPHEIPWPDQNTLVVLPIHPEQNSVLCIGKYLITNSQYKRFIEAVGGKEPVGSYLHNKKKTALGLWQEQNWRSGFCPWRDKDFNLPDQPVVCTSYYDALAYCNWVNRKYSGYQGRTFLPTPRLWDYAAFGTESPSKVNSGVWLNQSAYIHQKSLSPAAIDDTSSRVNVLGISDMIGNIWEWCFADSTFRSSGSAIFQGKPELRGGGFLDDLSVTAPFLDSYRLPQGENSCRFDLGFRIAARVTIQQLPMEVQERLSICVAGSWYLWSAYK